MYAAIKVVIITESSILDGIADILEQNGATGYTTTPAGGKGSRGKRRIDRSAQVAGILENIKVETIVSDMATAEKITDAVVTTYFDDYSGITYTQPVEILRPGKFHV